MRSYLAHVGHPGNVDLKYTLDRRRSRQEILNHISSDAEERSFFEDAGPLSAAFAGRDFNCWGVPPGAKSVFEKMEVGDLVLFAPFIGIHGGGIRYLGIVSEICEARASQASTMLWPDTPYSKVFPWLFFFDAEGGHRDWYDFLEDVGYSERYNPAGRFMPMRQEAFAKWSGVENYLKFLRDQCGFSPIDRHLSA